MIRKQKIGPLDCVLAGPNWEAQKPELVVVLCHGFGAPGTDLVPLTDEILSAGSVDGNRVLFVYPAAPMVLDSFGGFEGRAWWMINMQALADMMGTNDFSQLRTSVPPGMIEAREMLNEMLKELKALLGFKASQLILGGFSQGAMLTAETVLNSDENPLCLIQMSGTLICEYQWLEKVASHAGLSVLQSHGTVDPVLPFEASEWLRDLLINGGCEVEFMHFHGGHTIPMEMIQRIGQLLRANLK